MQFVTAAFRALGALFAFCWLFCAAFNAVVGWRVHVRRIARARQQLPWSVASALHGHHFRAIPTLLAEQPDVRI